MPDSHERSNTPSAALTITALVILFCLVMFAYDLGKRGGIHEGEANRYSAAEKQNIQGRITQFCHDGVDSVRRKCAIETLDAARDRQRNERNLQSQQDAARWNFWAMIIAAVQLPVGIAGLYLLIRSLNQTDTALQKAIEANDLTRTANDRQLRAYLYPIKAEMRLSKHGSDARFPIDVYLRNTGGTPAGIVSYRAEIHLISPITHMAAVNGGYANKLIRRVETRLTKTIGPNSETFLSFKANALIGHFAEKEVVFHEPEGSETIVNLFLSWDYVDFTGTTYSEFAEFTTDAVNWDLITDKTIPLRQSQSRGDL